MKFSPSTEAKVWYITQYGQTEGPLSIGEVRAKCKSPNVSSDTLMWKEGMAEWEPIYKIPELAPLLDVVRPGSNTQSNLRLSGQRAYENKNELDNDPNAVVEVSDMLAGQQFVSGKAGQNKHYQAKQSFVQRLIPQSIEFKVFWLFVILGGIGCAIFSPYWHAIVVLGAVALNVFTGLDLLIRAFIRHIGWGLACIFIPVAALVYYFVDWDNTWRALLISLIAFAAIFGTLKSPNLHESPVYKQLLEFKQHFDDEISLDS